MASISLTDSSSRASFFNITILNNLRYWQDWLTANPDEVAALDRERNGIVRAISFAFHCADAWPLAFDLLQKFSPFMERRGYWEAWQWVLTQALDTARQLDDTAAEVTLSALLARLLFQQSRYKEAVIRYRRTIRLARHIGDHFNEARACTNLGYHFVEQGYWHRAEVLCCHALELFEQLDSDHGRAHTENHLGFLYTRQHRWAEAQYRLERACEIWQTMGDQHGLMRGYLNLGLLYVDAAQPAIALNYLRKALYQAQQTGENIAVGRVYINIGKAYRLTGDLTQAEEYTRQAEFIFQQSLNLVELARAWNGLGLIYFQQNRWSDAIFYLKKSLEVWRSLAIKFEEIEVLLDIGECELSRGNRLQAMARLQEAKQIVGHVPGRGSYRHLLPRLDRYYHSLIDSAKAI